MRYTFKAHERLKREQHIDTLFHKGKAFSVFPLKFIHITAPLFVGGAPVQVGFSVPKKKFRHSVDRHRIVRLMREAWRLHKHLLYEALPMEKQLHVFLIFTNKDAPDYETVKGSVVKGMQKLIELYTVNVKEGEGHE